MSIVQILFYVFSAILVVSAIGVITSKNPVHAALFLVFAFFNSAIIWMLMEAEFLAIVLVLVYVGAVMVLFLFVVMMLDINVAKLREGYARYLPLGLLISGVIVAELFTVIVVRKLGLGDRVISPSDPTQSNTQALGHLLYTQYLYPFELAAMILLVAIVAAITLTMRKRPGLKQQDISKQVGAIASERVRIVKMPSEPRDVAADVVAEIGAVVDAGKGQST
jgi:NADH-quinone oxidoreductase subunit J